MNDKLPKLDINGLVLDVPIIQGGMGVRVSKARLAGAVSSEGALGVIASVGLGDEMESERDYIASSREALRAEVRKVKKKGLPLGVNIMAALNNYDSLVEVCVEEGVDLIETGAGLPLSLPELVNGDLSVKLAPIVSSARATAIICKTWQRRYKRLPDALIVEGPMAGGHLGFSFEELRNGRKTSLEQIVKEVLDVAESFRSARSRSISVIAAGGIFDGKDIARFLRMGASGVQMSTRFVATHECDAHDNYKETYINAKKEDIVVVTSPVGLPGRVIKNRFVERVARGEKIKFDCPYHCLRSCEPLKVNYCIADALVNASHGDMKNGFAMCGENAYKVNKIVSVKELVSELCGEVVNELSRDKGRG